VLRDTTILEVAARPQGGFKPGQPKVQPRITATADLAFHVLEHASDVAFAGVGAVERSFRKLARTTWREAPRPQHGRIERLLAVGTAIGKVYAA